MKQQLRELSPEALFHLVVKRWDLVVLLPLLAVLAAGLTYKILPARYESSARLLIQDQQTVNPFMEDMVEEWSAQQRMPLVMKKLLLFSIRPRKLFWSTTSRD